MSTGFEFASESTISGIDTENIQIPFTNLCVAWRTTSPSQCEVTVTQEKLDGATIFTEDDIRAVLLESAEVQKKFDTLKYQMNLTDAVFKGFCCVSIAVSISSKVPTEISNLVLFWVKEHILEVNTKKVCRTAVAFIKPMVEQKKNITDQRLEQCFEKLQRTEQSLEFLQKQELKRTEETISKESKDESTMNRLIRRYNTFLQTNAGIIISGTYKAFFQITNMMSAVITILDAKQRAQARAKEDSQQQS